MNRAADVVIGWPDLYGRREVRLRRTVEIIGFIRSTTDPVRYFAENQRHWPIEGTFKTRTAALYALLEATP